MSKKDFMPLMQSLDIDEVHLFIDKVEAIQQATKSERLASQMEMVLLHLFDRQDDLSYYQGDYDEMMYSYGANDYNMSDQDIENYYHDQKAGDRYDNDGESKKEPFVPYVRPSIVQLLKEAKAFTEKCDHLKLYGFYEVMNPLTNEVNQHCSNCCGRLKMEEGRKA